MSTCAPGNVAKRSTAPIMNRQRPPCDDWRAATRAPARSSPRRHTPCPHAITNADHRHDDQIRGHRVRRERIEIQRLQRRQRESAPTRRCGCSSANQRGPHKPSRTPSAASAGLSSAMPPTQANDIEKEGESKASGCGSVTANAAAAKTADAVRARPLSNAMTPTVSMVAARIVGRCRPARAA